MKRTPKRWALFLLTVVVCLTFSAVAAGGDLFPRSLISSGGGLVSQAGITLHSAIGQPAVGAVQNDLTLCSGYLCGAEAPPITEGNYEIYLPAITK